MLIKIENGNIKPKDSLFSIYFMLINKLFNLKNKKLFLITKNIKKKTVTKHLNLLRKINFTIFLMYTIRIQAKILSN